MLHGVAGLPYDLATMRGLLKSLRSYPPFATVLFGAVVPFKRRLQDVQEAIERHVHRSGGTVKFDGLEIAFPPRIGDAWLTSISWRGVAGFEPQVWAALRDLLPAASTFIDVGANIGFYSVLAAKLNPSLDILAFEPVPYIFEQNRKLHEANGLAQPTTELALGAEDGSAVIYLPNDESSSATLFAESWQARNTHREIPGIVSRLDTFLTARAPLRLPVVMKIDVEDGEAAVLTGAKEMIARYQPAIICEILPRHNRPNVPEGEQHENRATVAAIRSMQYTAFALTPTGLHRFTADDFAAPRTITDFLLVPDDFAGARSFAPTAADLLRH